MNVIAPSIPMRSIAEASSSLETECLFGETINISDNYLDWYYCKLLTDNYCGWVQKQYLGETMNSSHRVISSRSYLFKDNDINKIPIKVKKEDIDEIIYIITKKTVEEHFNHLDEKIELHNRTQLEILPEIEDTLKKFI